MMMMIEGLREEGGEVVEDQLAAALMGMGGSGQRPERLASPEIARHAHGLAPTPLKEAPIAHRHPRRWHGGHVI